MTLAERLKLIRESLGMSQSAMAKAADSSLPSWQGYEAGRNVPGGKVLEALARMGFNINWVLTGEGEMKRGWENRSAFAIGERIKEVRGSESLQAFAEKLCIEVNKLADYEQEKISPDVNFLADLHSKLRINPTWLLVGIGPKIFDDIVYSEAEVEIIASLDEKILRETLKNVQETYEELIAEGIGDETIFQDLVGMTEIIAYTYEEEVNSEEKISSKRKKAKVKRLVGLIQQKK